MTKSLCRIVIGITVLTLTAAIALADRKSDTVTFEKDTMVNGTLVKSGTYKVQFDYKTSELAVIKDTKPIATAPGRVEQSDRKASRTVLLTTDHDNTTVMTAITFGGDNRKIVVENGAAQTGSGTKK
jgi:hypothetical protein